MLFSISGPCKYPFRTSPWWKWPSKLLDLQPHQVQKENAVRFVLLLRHLATQGDQSVTASMKDTWVLLFTWTPLLLSDPFPTPLLLHSTSIGHRIPKRCHLELKRHNQCPKRSTFAHFAVNVTAECGAVPIYVYPGSASERDLAHGMPCNRVCEPAFASHLSCFCLQARAPPGSARLESKAGSFRRRICLTCHIHLYSTVTRLLRMQLWKAKARGMTCVGVGGALKVMTTPDDSAG